jgi:hypothetical protein
LDTETRGLISGFFNAAFEQTKVLDIVDWVLRADDQILSREDLALGYYIGSLMNMAMDAAEHKKLMSKVMSKASEGLKKSLAESKAKGGRPLKGRLTNEEIEEIKNMLIPMIGSFREKIRQEEALRRL